MKTGRASSARTATAFPMKPACLSVGPPTVYRSCGRKKSAPGTARPRCAATGSCCIIASATKKSSNASRPQAANRSGATGIPAGSLTPTVTITGHAALRCSSPTAVTRSARRANWSAWNCIRAIWSGNAIQQRSLRCRPLSSASAVRRSWKAIC